MTNKINFSNKLTLKCKLRTMVVVSKRRQEILIRTIRVYYRPLIAERIIRECWSWGRNWVASVVDSTRVGQLRKAVLRLLAAKVPLRHLISWSATLTSLRVISRKVVNLMWMVAATMEWLSKTLEAPRLTTHTTASRVFRVRARTMPSRSYRIIAKILETPWHT
jgi:hypothetical protein